MKQNILKNQAIVWLEKQNTVVKLRPCSFTPKEVTDSIGGYPGTLGRVAKEVVAELNARNIRISYLREGNVRKFELY